jgi:hypothetical protein
MRRVNSGEHLAFMQYWLINFGTPCPRGWNTFAPDCYKNSRAVSAPKQSITQLAHLKLSGSAVTSGTDTLIFTTEINAYSTTGKDSGVDLATDWHASEFNIIGDGGGSEAVFNKGSSITVKIAVTDGSTTKPTCGGRHAGTTGETNNLTLKSCTATGGSTPSIQFSESNGKKFILLARVLRGVRFVETPGRLRLPAGVWGEASVRPFSACGEGRLILQSGEWLRHEWGQRRAFSNRISTLDHVRYRYAWARPGSFPLKYDRVRLHEFVGVRAQHLECERHTSFLISQATSSCLSSAKRWLIALRSSNMRTSLSPLHVTRN